MGCFLLLSCCFDEFHYTSCKEQCFVVSPIEDRDWSLNKHTTKSLEEVAKCHTQALRLPSVRFTLLPLS